MKTLKRILSMMLVVCMIFTSQAFVTFAEGMENTEAIENETTIEETTVEADDDFVGAKLGEPEEETETQETLAEEPEEETTVGASTASPEEETTVGAKLGEPETEVKTESEAETEVEEKLFGAPPIYTLSLKPNFPEGFSLPEGKSWYEDKSGPLDSDTDSILIEGWNTRICVDTAGNVCNLTGYNTKADGSGTSFSYQESIFKEKLEYFDLPSDSYDLVLYAMWRTSKLYTIHYNQNLPEGYSLAEGSTWGNDATLWDYVDDFEFEIYDYTGMTCEDSDGKTLALIKWNTAADGTGDDQSFGDWITSMSFFTDGELTLYAVWGKEYTLSYNQNLPEGYNLSEGKTWYADVTFPDAESIYTEVEGSEDMTCEDANGITRKLLKWNTKADGTGTDYNFATEIADATHFTDYKLILYAVWSKVYTLSYNQNLPEGYNLSEGKTWYADVTFPDAESIYTEVEGWEDMTCEDATGITRKLLKWNTKADGAGTEYNFADEIADATHFTDYKLILYAVWEPVAPGPTPPGPTPPGPTPPGPTPPSPGGGETGGSSSGSSDPTHGPMGDLTKNPLYADTLNGTNNIPESKMVSNDTLATTLKSYPENVNSPMVNARDDSGNVGYGQWLRVPNTTTWYFLSGSFNQGTGTTNTGFLANGWFNLGWDGQDKWYYFDSAGVMKIGWHQEGNKIYYLQADFSDNWYGKAMTGQQMIGGQVYNFDSNGTLIQ